MPEISGSKIGQFCWFELATTDQAAAKGFYGGLFGWTANDLPMGPGEFYTMLQLRGRDVGACYTLRKDQREQGVPPHWMTYIAVASADDAAVKAAALGGKVIAPAFDVFDVGRMAVIQDPTGAMFCVWQAKKHSGVGVYAEPNAFCWSELMTHDMAAATKFYTGLFGWSAYVTTNPAGFSYTHWRMDGVDFGGMMALKPEWGPAPPHWMDYVSVTNCDETVAKATSLGGKICYPPMSIPDVGRFAGLQDPQGAVLSVIQLTHHKP
jgi:predicted enzyme related to lactoylglutathione lyase